jgi:hypothetical protein
VSHRLLTQPWLRFESIFRVMDDIKEGMSWLGRMTEFLEIRKNPKSCGL